MQQEMIAGCKAVITAPERNLILPPEGYFISLTQQFSGVSNPAQSMDGGVIYPAKTLKEWDKIPFRHFSYDTNQAYWHTTRHAAAI
ncbi:hypothetical protein [Thermopetrobacter sp. TC1]|uniref:hypothetical protein n=1 Tax=Thermopetrobacter sp. TC1 TaxID=1495045 RepID=UPI00056E6028|nr:hypothetical protein [Thermopetrobacter sp. TC1]